MRLPAVAAVALKTGGGGGVEDEAWSRLKTATIRNSFLAHQTRELAS